jgi:SPP1 family predicted phage head-tail adaptor
MRYRVVLSSPTTTIDSFGQEIEAYTTQATVWADVTEAPPTEQQIVNGTAEKKRIDLTVRSVNGISSRWRVQYRGDEYNIVGSSAVPNKQHYTRITAERAI